MRESGGWDFLAWLGPDASGCIFHRLDNPADLARAAAVSRSWRRFVIANEFCKSLCVKICPEVASFTRAVKVSESPPGPAAPTSEPSRDAERDHRIYSSLGGALVSTSPSVNCIACCIAASSTDRFPDERMENTLDPRAWVSHNPSYWSSQGHHDPDVPESLTYGLQSDLCIIDEIRIQPDREYYAAGLPVFSSKMVRIRIGHSKLPPSSDEDENKMDADENDVWMYTSPEFPMLHIRSAINEVRLMLHEMQVDKQHFSVNTMELQQPKVLVRPHQAEAAKGKNVVIGDAKPNLRRKELMREVAYEKTSDGRETFKITVKPSRHGGQASSAPSGQLPSEPMQVRSVRPVGVGGQTALLMVAQR